MLTAIVGLILAGISIYVLGRLHGSSARRLDREFRDYENEKLKEWHLRHFEALNRGTK